MILTVRPATSQEVSFAWPMYRDFIVANIFSKVASNKSQAAWTSDEETKFQKSWEHEFPHVIEIDDAPVGWLSMSKANNSLSIHNVFVLPAWQNKGIGERIFMEMIPVWKSEKRVVEVPVLLGAQLSAGVETTLQQLGFAPAGDDGLVRKLVADFSK